MDVEEKIEVASKNVVSGHTIKWDIEISYFPSWRMEKFMQ